MTAVAPPPDAAGTVVLRSDRMITFVPARPATIPGMSASAPMAARLPVLAANRTAASTLDPHGSAGELIAGQFTGCDMTEPALLRRAPAQVDAVDVAGG